MRNFNKKSGVKYCVGYNFKSAKVTFCRFKRHFFKINRTILDY